MEFTADPTSVRLKGILTGLTMQSALQETGIWMLILVENNMVGEGYNGGLSLTVTLK